MFCGDGLLAVCGVRKRDCAANRCATEFVHLQEFFTNTAPLPEPTLRTLQAVAVYIFGLACLTAASGLLVVVIAPAAYVGHWDSERERLLVLAFALLVADVVVTALIFAYSVYETNARALGG